MRVFWDTSGLLALALRDGCFHDARQVLAISTLQHITSHLVLLEAENRIHRMELAGQLSSQESTDALDWLEHVAALALIEPHGVRESRHIAAEGRRLIRHFSRVRPHGTMDVIHVACARLLKVEAFFTFDSNQAALAEAAGLRVSVS